MDKEMVKDMKKDPSTFPHGIQNTEVRRRPKFNSVGGTLEVRREKAVAVGSGRKTKGRVGEGNCKVKILACRPDFFIVN